MTAIACALYSEAKPLIEKLKLRPDTSAKGFKIFFNENFILIVTGVGKASALMGAAYLFGRYFSERPSLENYFKISCFVNIGIAGHKDLPAGELILGHKVSSFSKKESYYPLILFDFDGKTKEIITNDSIECLYEKDSIYDMEAFYLMQASSRFLNFELIHFIKIISDNVKKEPNSVTGKEIEGLISSNLNRIEQILEKIKKVAETKSNLHEEEDGSEFFQKWHFTLTEKYQLEDILNRLKVLSIPLSAEAPSLSTCKSAKEVLSFLQEKVKSSCVTIENLTL